MTENKKTFCVLDKRDNCQTEVLLGCEECIYCADEIEDKPYSPEWEDDCREEMDTPFWEYKVEEGRRLKDELCPEGFKFECNIAINSQTMELEYYAVVVGRKRITLTEYIAKMKDKYGDVQLTDAFDCYGRKLCGFAPLHFNEPYEIWYGVYIKV